MKTDINQLEKIALDYHTSDAIPDIHVEHLCQEYIKDWLIKQIPAGARVLELGYGDGLVTEALAKLDCELTLIEGAKSLVDLATNKYPDIECIYTLFEDYCPVKDYDVILASFIFEHVDEPQVLLKQLSSWLNDTGKIIIVVPNRNSLHRQLAVIMGLQAELDSLSPRDLLVGHQRVYSLQGLEDDVRQSGLEITDSAGFFLKVLPNSMMLDYSRELLLALNTLSESLPKDLLANIAVVAVKKN